MSRATVYLASRVGPGDKDWIQGEIIGHDATGVKVKGSSIGVDPHTVRFFPAHQIQSIEYAKS